MRGTRGIQLLRTKINTIVTAMVPLKDELLIKHSKALSANREQRLYTQDVNWVNTLGEEMAGHKDSGFVATAAINTTFPSWMVNSYLTDGLSMLYILHFLSLIPFRGYMTSTESSKGTEFLYHLV